MDTKPALIHPSWLEKLKEEFEKPYMRELERFLAEEIQKKEIIYPPFPNVFEALCLTPFDKVKVVIMGQDPYHGPNQAHGLSFSVQKGIQVPPSLQNIFKEIQDDLGFSPPSHGCLEEWAKQGVLLLNATLTVKAKEPKSHYGRGWEVFTDKIVECLYERKDPIVFLLWGKSAADKLQKISSASSHHLILTSPHPSPFSAHSGFLGCRHFSKANAFLEKIGKQPVQWSLSE